MNAQAYPVELAFPDISGHARSDTGIPSVHTIGQAGPITRLADVGGVPRELRLSPDGRSLAVVLPTGLKLPPAVRASSGIRRSHTQEPCQAPWIRMAGSAAARVMLRIREKLQAQTSLSRVLHQLVRKASEENASEKAENLAQADAKSASIVKILFQYNGLRG